MIQISVIIVLEILLKVCTFCNSVVIIIFHRLYRIYFKGSTLNCVILSLKRYESRQNHDSMIT
jgi:hypothetical protein